MTRVLDAARSIGRRGAMVALGAIALALVPLWGPRVLRHLAFFRIRRVEVEGLHFLSPTDLLSKLDVDTTMSVWTDLAPLEQRVARHPQVKEVSIERRLPGTLLVRVQENLPVALIPTREGYRPVDVGGRPLPIDPSRVMIDLPLLLRTDRAALQLLSDVRGGHPALFGRISDVRRVDRDELLLQMDSFVVRGSPDLSADRLADIIPVEGDLARRHRRAVELDLRFRDQVIARMQ
ncbi:MAG: cell division protein FtsQ/DivIB [Gemmatimonadaceae bacterium]